MKRDAPDRCELCGREKPLTFHHLIPRKTHRKRAIRARHSRAELITRGIWLCRLCHRQIHRFYDERELADRLNTKDALESEPQMARFLEWARKQK